jgi:bifunctional polynucleotide phosphatase/kinase
MGKTTTYNKYFKPAGYVYVDRKSFKTESDCMKAMEDSIKAGKSVVVGRSRHSNSGTVY